MISGKFPPGLNKIYDQSLANQLANANAAIASLNQMQRLLHNPSLLMRPILAKEAESSSQLEGTQASIEDAYKIDVTEQTEEKRNNALEIRNYEEAMLTGLDVLDKTQAVSDLMVREIHKTLLQGVRGQNKHPGEYRKGNVWVGVLGTTKEKARYLPPDAAHIQPLMSELHNFINNRGDIHPLIACGLIHHRFEAIHPFEDGNGRVGRVLITLYLKANGILTFPILYPSGYFDKTRDEYLAALSRVDKKDDWYQWLLYFLKGMETQAKISLKIALDIDTVYKESKQVIEKERASLNLIRVLEQTFVRPFATSAKVSQETGIPRTSCDRYLQTLAEKKVIVDIGIHKRQKVFVNQKLLDLLTKI